MLRFFLLRNRVERPLADQRAGYKRKYQDETMPMPVHLFQEIAKQNISAGYSRLDPGNKERGKLIRRWRLWVNVASFLSKII